MDPRVEPRLASPRSTHPLAAGVDSVQARIGELVAQIEPTLFRDLAAFADEHQDYRDLILATFAREVDFYLDYLAFLAPMRASGLPICYPKVSSSSREVSVADTWDIALAARLISSGERVVTNDLLVTGRERIVVITGPNQGGKTTMARSFGQLHLLAALGCPVPGRHARVRARGNERDHRWTIGRGDCAAAWRP